MSNRLYPKIDYDDLCEEFPPDEKAEVYIREGQSSKEFWRIFEWLKGLLK
jgi:hypothetical protein